MEGEREIGLPTDPRLPHLSPTDLRASPPLACIITIIIYAAALAPV